MIRGLRSLCWKLLLGYLPTDKKKWDTLITEKKQIYDSFCSDFFCYKYFSLTTPHSD